MDERAQHSEEDSASMHACRCAGCVRALVATGTWGASGASGGALRGASGDASSDALRGVAAPSGGALWGAAGPSGGALWRAVLAEAVGATLLVALSCAAPETAPAAQRALASGLAVALLVQSLDHISGAQLNPTVTLASVVWGRMSAAAGLAYVGAQLAGAALGAALLPALGAAPRACCTLPAPRLAPLQAAALEALGGGCLALVNCAAWDARNSGLRDSWPLRIGLTVAGLALLAGEQTGASFNPARSFGPALYTAQWTQHWVYWLGPLGGALASTLLYVGVWRPAPKLQA